MQKLKLLVLVLVSRLTGSDGGMILGNEVLRTADSRSPETARSAAHWKRKTAEAIGKPELAEGSDEELEAAHGRHLELVNAMASGTGDFNAAEMPAGPAEEVAANDKVREAELALANERRERAEELIAQALGAGRIKPVERAQWESDFAADFTGARSRLANVKAPVVKVEARTAQLGQRNNGVADAAAASEKDRSHQVQSLVNEKMAKNTGLNYDAAFRAVEREHPALFEAMRKPALKS